MTFEHIFRVDFYSLCPNILQELIDYFILSLQTWPFTFNGRVVGGLEGKSPDSLKHSSKTDLTGNAKC